MLVNKLKKYLNFENGFFIEVGAHDGIFQSNTLNLEESLGWKGILIEPSLNAYLECIKNRPKSICINLALTSFEQYKKKDFVFGDFNSSPMSSVAANRSGFSKFENFKNYLSGITKKKLRPVSTAPLQLIIDKIGIDKVDFLSLDVEGFEYEVLKGVNFNKCRPKYILIEIREIQKKNIFDLMLSLNYTFLENISNFNKSDFPKWDGTHQDYFFKSND